MGTATDAWVVTDGQETKSHQREERSTRTATEDGADGSKDVCQETPATPEGTPPCHTIPLNELTMNSDRDDQRRSTDRSLTYHFIPASFKNRAAMLCRSVPSTCITSSGLHAEAAPQVGRQSVRRKGQQDRQISLHGSSLL